MEVCIIDQEFRHPQRYQIMVRARHGFYHVFPGQLFTLEGAQEVCKQNGYEVVAIGNNWQCLK